MANVRSEGEKQPLFRLIRHEGMKRERPFLLETLKALAEGHVEIECQVSKRDMSASVDGKCLDQEVEWFIESA